MSHDDDAQQKTLWDLIRQTRFAMVTTQCGDGRLRSRPLTTQNRRDDDGDRLWFFTSLSGEVAEDVRHAANVNITYADIEEDAYVSVSGRARFVDDPARKEALFNTMTKAWFPKGPHDPALGLLEVTIDAAEYWNVKESKTVQLVKMATAAITGKPPSMGEHSEVDVGR